MRNSLLVLIILSAAPALAQDQSTSGVNLTLAEAERWAVDRNPRLATARLEIDAADYQVALQRAAYSPLFSASILQRSQTSPSTTQLSGGQDLVSTDSASYVTGLTQGLSRGGGRIDVDFSGTRTGTSNVFATYNPSFSSSATASITQPLLRGLRFDATRAQIAQAGIGRRIADVELRQQAATMLATVRRAYWELVYAVDALETALESESLARQQVQDNRVRLELGTVAPIDVLESEAEMAARHRVVTQAEGAWRTAQVALKQEIVSGTSDPVWASTIVPVDRPTAAPRPLDASEAVANALSNRTDLAVMRQQRESSDVDVRLLGEERQPSIDLTVSYGLNGIGGTQILRQSGTLGSEIVGTQPGAYLDVLRSLGALDYPTWTVGLNVTLPIGTRAADAAYARGQVARRQADVRVDALELQVAAQVTRTSEQVRSTEEQMASARVARELAERRLEAEEARRAAGLSTTFAVLQAQRDLATAQTGELRAQLDYRLALVDFDLAQEAA
jgi:outer membrane protein TolC